MNRATRSHARAKRGPVRECLVSILLLATLSGCAQEQAQPSWPAEPVPSEPIADVAPLPDEVAPAGTAATLQGTWQSTEDPAYVIEIAGDQFVDLYSGETTRVATLTFVTSCEDDTAAPDGQYFTVTDEDGPLCYYLLRADGDALEYSYVTRGNTLSFVRMQPDETGRAGGASATTPIRFPTGKLATKMRGSVRPDAPMAYTIEADDDQLLQVAVTTLNEYGGSADEPRVAVRLEDPDGTEVGSGGRGPSRSFVEQVTRAGPYTVVLSATAGSDAGSDAGSGAGSGDASADFDLTASLLPNGTQVATGEAARLSGSQLRVLRELYDSQRQKTGILIPTFVPERFEQAVVPDSTNAMAYLVYEAGAERIWIGTGELEGLGGPGLIERKPCVNPVFHWVAVGVLETDANLEDPPANPEYQTEFWFEIPGRGNPADPLTDGYAHGFTLAGNIDQDELIQICESLRLLDVGQ